MIRWGAVLRCVLQQLDDLFDRAGGRNGKLSADKFLGYFDDAEDRRNMRFEVRVATIMLNILHVDNPTWIQCIRSYVSCWSDSPLDDES